MKSCYVSIAFGRKLDAAGQEVDYDRIYNEMIRPAVEAAGLACHRGDEFTGALIHKEILRAVLTADVMVADVSNGNANVMYELGIRHALRRGATVLLTSDRLPFNLAQSFAIRYAVGADGAPTPDAVAELQRRLTRAVQERAERDASDSPVYEYFPTLQVDLPTDLQPPQALRNKKPGASVPPGGDSRQAVARAERAARSRAPLGEPEYADLMRRFTGLGAWADVVRLAKELPAPLRGAPGLLLLEAQAQAQEGNLGAAIGLLSELVAQQPEHVEALSLLGSLLKQRYSESNSRHDLNAAISMYRRAFNIGRQDLYLGRNLAQLLHAANTDAAREELLSLLPELERLVGHALAEPPLDYWTLHSAVMIAALRDDGDQARDLVDRMLALQPKPWMLESSRNELSVLRESSFDITRRERLRALMGSLELSAEAASRDAEDDAEADDAQP